MAPRAKVGSRHGVRHDIRMMKLEKARKAKQEAEKLQKWLETLPQKLIRLRRRYSMAIVSTIFKNVTRFCPV